MMLMQDDDWAAIKHFCKSEKWGKPEKMAARLVYALDKMRAIIGKPIHIHNAYATSGHTEGSYHYLGMAVDCRIEGLHVVDQYLIACKFPDWGGIGVYPYWGKPGLHLDVGQPGRRWARNADGKYVPLNWEFIKALK